MVYEFMIFMAIIDYPSVPHACRLKTSVLHKGHTFSAPLIRLFNTNLSVPYCMDHTLCQKENCKARVLRAFFRICLKMNDLCWTDGFLGLKRSGPCVELTCRSVECGSRDTHDNIIIHLYWCYWQFLNSDLLPPKRASPDHTVTPERTF